MDKNRIKKLAGDPRFISGIHNYCDRWCERCPLTHRCLNYLLSEEEFADPETRDLENEKFWEKLSEVLSDTVEMLHEMAEEAGIDLDAVDATESLNERKNRRKIAENRPAVRSARAYGKMVNQWFDKANHLLKEKEIELLEKARLELPHADPAGEAADITDATEIIRWYQHQIYVKLMRAFQGKEDEAEDPELWKEFPKDSDGSAKVSLIGIDRSISAWDRLRSHFPERESELLNILRHLDRLRKKVEKEFPEARSFVRPGLDNPEEYGEARRDA